MTGGASLTGAETPAAARAGEVMAGIATVTAAMAAVTDGAAMVRGLTGRVRMVPAGRAPARTRLGQTARGQALAVLRALRPAQSRLIPAVTTEGAVVGAAKAGETDEATGAAAATATL